jgi:hypothetical protein
MRPKIIKMSRKPAIELCGLNFATRLCTAQTNGIAKEGMIYSVPCMMVVRLTECTGVSENGEKQWNAKLEEVKA